MPKQKYFPAHAGFAGGFEASFHLFEDRMCDLFYRYLGG